MPGKSFWQQGTEGREGRRRVAPCHRLPARRGAAYRKLSGLRLVAQRHHGAKREHRVGVDTQDVASGGKKVWGKGARLSVGRLGGMAVYNLGDE